MERVSLLLFSWTPQHHHFSNSLHGSCVGLRTNRGADGLARLPIPIENPHLDELVGGQRAIDLLRHRARQAAVADLHPRFERMSSGLEVGALARRQ